MSTSGNYLNYGFYERKVKYLTEGKIIENFPHIIVFNDLMLSSQFFLLIYFYAFTLRLILRKEENNLN